MSESPEDPTPEQYKIIDIPVVNGVATLPNGQTVRSESPVVRCAVLVGELNAVVGEDVADPAPDSLDAELALAELVMGARVIRSSWRPNEDTPEQVTIAQADWDALRALAAKLCEVPGADSAADR